MRICVDTTVLVDILKDEFRQYQEMVYRAIAARERLLAPTVVVAELMPQFGGDTKQIQGFLNDHTIGVEPLDLDAVITAGKRWMKFLKRKSKATCPQCKYTLDMKEHLLSDFYIGGFALTRCDAILTRDRGIYQKYFSDLAFYGGEVKK